MLNEANIIDQLKANFPQQIGDDAAIIPYSDQQSYVISKDLLIENVHFNLAYCDPTNLAYKSLHVNLSDLAAMGARPQFVLLGIAIPATYEPELPNFLQAFSMACKEANVILIGGDTTKSPHQLVISVTAIGIVENSHIKYRSHAMKDDLICVIGQLGYAHVGLQAYEQNKTELELFKQHFQKPTALVEMGGWLAQQAGVTAMMDLSDGLWIDLSRLCEASQVSAILHCDQFSTDEKFTTACKVVDLDPLITQLTGGEDYSLLITVKDEHFATIASQFEARFKIPITSCGVIGAGTGITLKKQNKPIHLELTPFSHFGELS